jgi:hypothetical protein
MKIYKYLSIILLINGLSAADGLPGFPGIVSSSSSAAVVSVKHSGCDGLCGDHDCEEVRRHVPSGKGACGKWLDKVTPKGGWITTQVEDLESPSLTCEMCDRETIRYAHMMTHPRYVGALSVGCICAGYMTGDIAGAKKHEATLHNQLKRRQTFLAAEFKTSERGNSYINVRKAGDEPSHNVVFTRSKYGQYTYIIDGTRSNIWKPSLEEARKAAADALFPTVLAL